LKVEITNEAGWFKLAIFIKIKTHFKMGFNYIISVDSYYFFTFFIFFVK